MVAQRRTHNRFSFSVRMKRSATPLPSGSRTKLGELSMPKKATSCWTSSARELEPWSCRSRNPRATPSPIPPKRSRMPGWTTWRPPHGRAQRPSGRPPGFLLRRRPLIVLPHLDTPPASTLSQSSVQENPGAQDGRLHVSGQIGPVHRTSLSGGQPCFTGYFGLIVGPVRRCGTARRTAVAARPGSGSGPALAGDERVPLSSE